MYINDTYRSGGGGGGAIAENPNGDEPVRVRGVPQGVPEGPEPAAAQEGPQPPLEAQAEAGDTGKEAGVRVPGGRVRAPQSGAGAGGPDGDQEALLPEARG